MQRDQGELILGATLPPPPFCCSLLGFDDSAIPVSGKDKLVELLKEEEGPLRG